MRQDGNRTQPNGSRACSLLDLAPMLLNPLGTDTTPLNATVWRGFRTTMGGSSKGVVCACSLTTRPGAASAAEDRQLVTHERPGWESHAKNLLPFLLYGLLEARTACLAEG